MTRVYGDEMNIQPEVKVRKRKCLVFAARKRDEVV